MDKANREGRREHRHQRVRKRVAGKPERPRLNVFRSSKHIHAQIIDDVSGRTLVAASSLVKELRAQVKKGCTKQAARAVGQLIGQRAKAQGITRVVFDRGGYLYHGRVKELADGARAAGLQF
jgi:large subunit ribosomal protein L18